MTHPHLEGLNKIRDFAERINAAGKRIGTDDARPLHEDKSTIVGLSTLILEALAALPGGGVDRPLMWAQDQKCNCGAFPGKACPVSPCNLAAPVAAVKPFAWCRAYDNDGEPVDEIVWGSERPADWSEGSPCYRRCDVAAAAFSLAEQQSMTRNEAWKLAWDEVKNTPLSQVGDLWQATEKRCNEILAANGGGEP